MFNGLFDVNYFKSQSLMILSTFQATICAMRVDFIIRWTVSIVHS